MAIEDLKLKLDKPEGRQIWDQLSRPEKMLLISHNVPEFSDSKLKDKFEFLDHLDSYSKTGITTPKTTPGGFPNPQYLDNPPAGAEKPPEQKAAEAIQTVGEGMAVGNIAGKMGLGVGGFAARVKNALGRGTVKEGYENLDSLLARKGIEPGISEITENTPKAIAEYAKKTKGLLKVGESKGREFLADAETEGVNSPEKLERIREDVTRIFNNKWESTKTQVGRDLSRIKEEATNRLIGQVPEIGDALDEIKGAYDKEKLVDAITKSAKVLGTAALGGLGLKSGMNLAQKVTAPFSGQ